jgi:two-component system invasion response regulator UvrY
VTIEILRRELPGLGIVVISMMHEEHYGADSLAAGADAYVMKQAATDELVGKIREVAEKRAS